jgi:hypothetical protein
MNIIYIGGFQMQNKKNILAKTFIYGLLIIAINFEFSYSKTWEKVPGTLNYVNFIKFSEYFKTTLYVGSDAQPTDFTTNNISFPFFGDGFQVSKNSGETFSTPYLTDYSIYDLIEVISQDNAVLAVSARKQDLGRVIVSNELGVSWDMETKRCESPSQITRFYQTKEGDKYRIYASAINSTSGFRYSDNFFGNCNLSSEVSINTRDISVSKTNPSVIYLAADNVAKQKVLVSKDKGVTWLGASVGLENYRILCVQVSPTDEKTVLVGADSVSPTGKIIGIGIFMSKDYGTTWTNVGAKGASIYDIQFHPSNPKYWAAAGGDKGVYISGTNGSYWEASTDGLPDGYFARKVAIPDVAPTSAGIIVYASIYGNGIFKSQPITTDINDENILSEKDKYRIFPNPVNEVLNINVGNSNSIINYDILDILSNKILSGQFSGNSSIDLSSFSTGIYFIRLNDSGIIKVLKFNKL